MKILVDADACPVKSIVSGIAESYGLELIMIADTAHILNSAYGKTVTVDKQRDSADFAILNMVEKGDIVVTGDYGLASMVLSKSGYAIGNNGMEYTHYNIDRLLMERHLNKKMRELNKKHTSTPKRTKEDNQQFERNFKQIIERILNILF